MAIFLDRIDAAPIANTKDSPFPFEFIQWLSVLVDTLNELIIDVQDAFNVLNASPYTSVEIAALDPDLPDGVLLYDTDLNVYVGKESGALVKFTTTPYP